MPGKGKPFERGNKLAQGRPELPDDVRRARKINQIEFERIVNKYIYMGLAEAESEMKRTDLPLIELMVASIIQKAIKQGDQIRLDFLMNRTIGRVPLKINLPTGDEGAPMVREVTGMSDDEVKSELALLEARRVGSNP